MLSGFAVEQHEDATDGLATPVRRRLKDPPPIGRNNTPESQKMARVLCRFLLRARTALQNAILTSPLADRNRSSNSHTDNDREQGGNGGESEVLRALV